MIEFKGFTAEDAEDPEGTKQLGDMLGSALLLILVSPFAHAEVMDKEFSLVVIWAWASGSAILFYVAARLVPALLVLAVPVPAVFFFAHLSEVVDPFVGPAMLDEAGAIYIASSWAAPIISLCGIGLGLWHRRRRASAQQAVRGGRP